MEILSVKKTKNPLELKDCKGSHLAKKDFFRFKTRKTT